MRYNTGSVCCLLLPSLDLVVMWLLMPHRRWMWGGPCLFVVCLCVPRVVSSCVYVHAWPSVALECVQV